MVNENAYQRELLKKLRDMFPKSDTMILKNDANYIQGVPDITILHKDRWAILECKRDANAPHRPNQDYYVDKLNGMSYAAFIYPENEERILREVQQALGA